MAELDIEQTVVLDQSEHSRKETTEKRDFQKPKVAQVLELTKESERESVSKTVAATVREILGEPEPSVSVRTLTITGGVLGMTHAAKQECNIGTWILADTGATHEPMGLRKGQKIPAGTRPCNLQLAISRVDGWTIADGVVYIVSDTELPSIFPICRVIPCCNMSWTLKSTGGDLVGDNEHSPLYSGFLFLCRSSMRMNWHD